MLGVKVRKESAEKIKKYLARQKLMDINYKLVSANEFIYFPIGRPDAQDRRFLSNQKARIVEMKFDGNPARSDYRKRLKKSLGKGYDDATKSYDIIGDIALIDAKRGATARKTARVIMDLNRNVKTVLSKGGPVSGRYRIRKYVYVAGEKKYDTIYNENGASFRIDVRRSFFSTRLAYERNRISELVKDGENVAVMFAGIGPFAIEIAKKHRNARVVAIELNRQAYGYMLENIKLNKVKNVEARLGDVKRVAPQYPGFADRIVMPLPKSAQDFLVPVLKMSKKRCVVHYYAFGKNDTAFEDNELMLRNFFRMNGRRIRVVFRRVVRTYSAKEIEIVIDFLIY
jgi:tRNA (guanine37-N1)-methyltransferase